MAINENLELLESVDPTVRTLLDDHRERRHHWGIADLSNLSAEASEVQEKMLVLPQLIARREKFEARYAPVVV